MERWGKLLFLISRTDNIILSAFIFSAKQEDKMSNDGVVCRACFETQFRSCSGWSSGTCVFFSSRYSLASSYSPLVNKAMGLCIHLGKEEPSKMLENLSKLSSKSHSWIFSDFSFVVDKNVHTIVARKDCHKFVWLGIIWHGRVEFSEEERKCFRQLWAVGCLEFCFSFPWDSCRQFPRHCGKEGSSG